MNSEAFLDHKIRILVAVVLPVLVSLAPVAAETIKQQEFRRMNPEIMGQGGSYVAVAEGYSALFTNPAGIAFTDKYEITLPSVIVWAHSRPDLLLSTIGALSGDASDTPAEGEEKGQEDLATDALREQFTTNGFGVGSALGVGYVGHNIGVGLEAGFDSYLYGSSFPLGLEGEINNRVALVVGYAYPFELGPVTLAVGSTLRSTIRVSSFVDSEAAADLITMFAGVDTGDGETGTRDDSDDLLETITALNGWGVAFDGGLIARYNAFSVGVQARNLFNTQMNYSNNTVKEILNAVGKGGLPAAPEDSDDPAYVSATYIIPMEVSFGVAWKPDLGSVSGIFDPEVHAQVTDPFAMTDEDPGHPRAFGTRLHFGTELTFLRFFDLRFGINQGYFTLGTGLDLGFLEIQYALYSQEYGRDPGDQKVGGSALEVAIRF